ncbi:unnamed protein product [Leptosia nina]|uniref:Uncharacterized protein n=1 Tax=Leptosia nina TaxID=320188 RepID=A0AAV1JCJ0_9NEOP
MSLLRTLKVLVILFNLLTVCANGETGNIPLDMHSLSADQNRYMYPNTIYYPRYSYSQDRSMEGKSAHDEKVTFDNFFDSVNDVTNQQDSRSRAATKFAPTTFSKPLTYHKPSYTSWPSSIYHEPTLAPMDTDFLKPKFGLLESGIKTPNKLGSLLHLGFALLGGSGFKETLINNILRPLLASKGALKSFIGKLSIPIVALVLVNVEILFVVWWLWEECPEVPVETMTPFSAQAPVSNLSTFE